MRYTCPSCKRIFYLETETLSPCPACGTTLSAGGEDEAAPADSGAPAAPQQADGETQEGSWLLGDGAGDAPPAPAAEPPPPVEPQTQPQPSATSWLSQPAAGPTPEAPADPGGSEGAVADQTGLGLQTVQAAGPDAEPPISDELQTIGVSAQPTQPPASGAMPTLRVPQPSAQTEARLPAARAPSSSWLFIVTGATVLLVAGIAVGLIMWLNPQFVVPQSDQAATVERLEKTISELETKRDKLADEKAKAEQDAQRAKEDFNAISLQRGRLEDEVEQLRKSLDARAGAARLTLDAVGLLERRGDLAKALRKTEEALKADSGFLLAQRVKGQVLAASRSGFGEQALLAFDRADEAVRKAGGAGDAEALVRAGGVCLTDLNDSDRALDYYKRAAAAGKKTGFGLVARARALQLDGKLDDAAAAAAEARKVSPSLGLAPLVLGEIALTQALGAAADKRKVLLREADELLAAATKLDPRSARARLMRGKVLLERARLESGGFLMARLKLLSDAERQLETARMLKPKLAEAHAALGELRLIEGVLRDPAIALARAKEAVELTGGSRAPSLALYARALAASGNPAEAVGTIERAIKLDRRNAEYPVAKSRYQREAKGLSPR